MGLSKVAVFSGSSAGADPAFMQAAEAVGDALARAGIELICGGGASGLMQAVSSAAVDKGGLVTAVVPPTEQNKLDPSRFTSVVLVDSLHERKATMSRLSDGFIVLPGGSGTLEEFFEQWSWAQIGVHDKRVGVLNVLGYFDPLLGMFQNMLSGGFTRESQTRFVRVSNDVEQLLVHLASPRDSLRMVGQSFELGGSFGGLESQGGE